jgi:hypothetical protein
LGSLLRELFLIPKMLGIGAGLYFKTNDLKYFSFVRNFKIIPLF